MDLRPTDEEIAKGTEQKSCWHYTKQCWHCTHGCCAAVKDGLDDLRAACPPSALKAQPLITDRAARLVAQRRCTDVFCLGLFLLVQAGALLIAFAAFSTGDPQRLVHGSDYSGHLCEHDTYYPRLGADLRAYNAVWQDHPFELPHTIPLYGVCVDRCPERGEWVQDYGCVAGDAACAWSDEMTELTQEEYKRPNEWLAATATVSVMRRCVPWPNVARVDVELCVSPRCDQLVADAGVGCYDDFGMGDRGYWAVTTAEQRQSCLSFLRLRVRQEYRSRSSNLEVQFVGSFFRGLTPLVRLLERSIPELVVFGVLVSIAVSMALLHVLRYVVRGVFHLVILLLFAVLILADVIAFAQAGVLNLPALTNTSLGWVEDLTLYAGANASALSLAGMRAELTTNAAAASWLQVSQAIFLGLPAALLIAILLLILLGLLVIALGRLWPAINQSQRIIRESTRIIYSSSSLLALPLIEGVLGCALLAWFSTVIAYLITPEPQRVELLHTSSEVLQFVTNATVTPSDVAVGMAAYSTLATAWLLAFTKDLGYTIVASVVTYDYFLGSASATDAPHVPHPSWPLLAATRTTLVYHAGSIAFGSATIGACRALRRVLELIKGVSAVVEDINPLCSYNPCLVPAITCLGFANFGLEISINYISVFGLTFIASDGFAFCSACVQTFHLVTAYPLQLGLAEAAEWMLTLLLGLTAPLICATLAYFAALYEWRGAAASAGALSGIDDDWSEGGSPSAGGVALAVFMLAGWVSHQIETTFDAVSDTLLMLSVRDHRHDDSKHAKPELTEMFEMHKLPKPTPVEPTDDA